MNGIFLTVSAPAAAVEAASPSVAAVPAAAACVNCGAAREGEWCARCGQRAMGGRFTLRRMGSQLAEAFDLDRGLLFTAVALSRRPGEAIREYVGGATVRYANPVKYLVLCVAVAVFASVQTGVTRELAGGITEGMRAEAAARAQEITGFLHHYMNVLMAAAVPFVAGISRLVYRRAGFNFAEHLIFNTFVYAQQCLVFLPFLLLPMHGPTKTWGMTGYTLASSAYYAWAATAFFDDRRWRGVLRALTTVVLGTAAYYVAAILFVAVAMIATGVG